MLDIDTAMGNDTQLGHASSLQSGQRVPDGKRYHGSPAQETHGRLLPVRGQALHVAAALALFRHPAGHAAWLIFAPAAIMILNYWYPFSSRYTGGTELDYGAIGAALLPLALLVSLVAASSARWRSGWWAWRSSRGCSTGCCSRRRPTCCTGSTTGSTASWPAPAIRGSTISCSATAPPSSTT